MQDRPPTKRVLTMNPLASAVTMTALVAASATVHAQSDFYRRTMPPNASEGGVAGLAVIAGHRYPTNPESASCQALSTSGVMAFLPES